MLERQQLGYKYKLFDYHYGNMCSCELVPFKCWSLGIYLCYSLSPSFLPVAWQVRNFNKFC